MNKSKEFNNWTCEECEKTMPLEEFPAHLKEKHGIECDNGTREMLMHADAKDFYDWKYRWTIAGKTFVQHTRTLRRGADKKMWQGA